MDKFGEGAKVIIAGASGLVGNELLTLLEQQASIEQIYALVRKPLERSSEKVVEFQHEDLVITNWEETTAAPDIGFICLGTTIKKAGSKEELAHIDYELVCRVAREMKLLGVNRIAVVSSLGASATSLSHYLRCKGKMEKSILTMGFERVVFVRPGPLAGNRKEIRKDEQVVGAILNVLNPLLLGYLGNFKPIQARNVAKAMLYTSIKPAHTPSDAYITLNSKQMVQMLKSFHQESRSEQ